MNKKVRATIKGLEWDFLVLDDSDYNRLIDKDNYNSLGVCMPNDHKVVFRKEGITLVTIKHELTHAYAASCFYHQLDLSGDQMAELKCEIVAYHGEELSKLAKQILKMLKKIAKDL